MSLFTHMKSLHNVFWLTFTVKKNLLLISDNDTKKLSFYLKIINTNPFIRIVSSQLNFTFTIHPIVLLYCKANFFKKIHFRWNLPSDIFRKFQKYFLWIYAACAFIFLFLRVVKKFSLMAKDERFYDICGLLPTFIYFIK